MEKVIYETIDQVKGLKAVNIKALTQDDERLEEKLLDNINKMGRSVGGFKKTRLEVLTEEFDREALEELVEVSVELTSSIGEKKVDDFVRRILKDLLERVFRDFVPLGFVKEFRLAIAQRVNLNEWDIQETINEMEKYFTCGIYCTVADSYRHACHELKEGKVIYLVPTAY